MGKAEGIEEGRERGRKEKAIDQKNREIARSLKEKGVHWRVISSSTGLPLDEIAKL